jgi:uncharacterized protein YndB with AHSA1/START domain
MTDTVDSDTRSLLVEADIPYPLDKVWRAITDSEAIALWFMRNDLTLEVGRRFTLRSRPIERWDGEFQCRLLAAEPEHRISFSWKGGHEELKGFGHFIDTVATWTLTPLADGGTHMVFEQTGFSTAPEADGVYDAMLKGGQSVMRTLARIIPDLDEE